MKIAFFKEDHGPRFDEEQYIVDVTRPTGSAEAGDLVCYCTPFRAPLRLEFAIRANGELAFRSWKFINENKLNPTLHTDAYSVREAGNKGFVPTEAQIDTVNGLYSGRITFEGLHLTVGSTILGICPIDPEREAKLAAAN